MLPDLRGFGATDKPASGPSRDAGPEVHAADMLALLDHLGIDRVGLVGHDVGAYVAQALARQAPDRIAGLFFFNCPYAGIGRRWAEVSHLIEIWYQSFHQQTFAAELVGSSRAACRIYIGHFLRHWARDPHAFDADLEVWVDNFMRPGNLQGGFNWYLSAAAARAAVIREEVPPMPSDHAADPRPAGAGTIRSSRPSGSTGCPSSSRIPRSRSPRTPATSCTTRRPMRPWPRSPRSSSG